MRTSRSDARPLTILVAGIALVSTACLLVLLAAGVVFLHPTVNAEPAQTTATVGNLRYSVNNAWVLDPQRQVDEPYARGLPAAARHLGQDELLYAVFVEVTNGTAKPVPMATDLALRDVTNREYAALTLAGANPYAYRPATMAPMSQQPAARSPAGVDQSAEGLMLVFRIPRQAYENGPLELLVHDPADPASTGSMQVL